jgi:hypothetical protein
LSHKDSHHRAVIHRVDNDPVLVSTEKKVRTEREERGEGASPPDPTPDAPSGNSSGEKKRTGRAVRPAPPAKTTIPSDLVLNEAMLAFATKRGFSVERAESQFQLFVNHHLTKATLSASWEANWRTWVIKRLEFDQRDAEKAAAERPAGRGSEWEGIV